MLPDEGLALTLAIGGGLVAVANVLATFHSWASPVFETPQKIAQTILLWLVPGSVVVIWLFLRETKGRSGRGWSSRSLEIPSFIAAALGASARSRALSPRHLDAAVRQVLTTRRREFARTTVEGS